MVLPKYVSDEELAQHPIVVVAFWDGTTLVANHSLDAECNSLQSYEIRTSITVERVVVGELSLGDHWVLMTEYAVGWSPETGRLMNYISTSMEGDVEDVRQPNLWFLSLEQSWDSTEESRFPTLGTYRGVQPLCLERYFQALRSTDPRKEVPRLLEDSELDVVLRALEYVAGPLQPETYIDGRYFGDCLWGEHALTDLAIDWDYYDIPRPWGQGTRIHPSRTFPWARSSGTPLVEQAENVRKLLSHFDLDIRRRAADVYGDLVGNDGIPQFRALLVDPDEHTRAIAAGWLITLDDNNVAQEIDELIGGLSDPLHRAALGAAFDHWTNESPP